MRSGTVKALALGLLLVTTPILHAQTGQYDFMPSGGRTLLTDLFAGDSAALAETASRSADRAEWLDWALVEGRFADDRAAETFAAYAAFNFPLTSDQRDALASGDLDALPLDGKDLAIAHCQFCHSFFSGYLMIKREEPAWLGTFNAPFHTEIKMTEIERKTFAAYSALNMPLKFEDVPPELRF
ncbi:hypothetical protein [Marimonas lutisalis]|uniref:hypothetical protein n=1 Tax=Marimonas lutisalis TaxID=2545756 RepID=UPI0010F61758|nr:hypothetical protein [Marimonas lutisalis]